VEAGRGHAGPVVRLRIELELGWFSRPTRAVVVRRNPVDAITTNRYAGGQIHMTSADLAAILLRA